MHETSRISQQVSVVFVSWVFLKPLDLVFIDAFLVLLDASIPPLRIAGGGFEKDGPSYRVALTKISWFCLSVFLVP